MRLGALSCRTVLSLALAQAACSNMTPVGPDAGGTEIGPGSCPGPVAADPHVAERLSCAFPAGARASATSGFDDTARAALPIRHVIVVMKENRSFDHIFGALGATQPDAETFPAGFTNPDPHGNPVAPYHLN